MKTAIAFSLFLIWLPSLAEDAEDAWKKLVGPDSLQRDGLEFVNHRTGLPDVLIYGDSISMGHTPVVRELLAGRVKLYRLHTNGGIRLLDPEDGEAACRDVRRDPGELKSTTSTRCSFRRSIEGPNH